LNNNKLHIISFDVPYPPIYGGVIDVFYKIKALHKLGVKIHLHAFDNGIGKQLELNKYCDKIHYYPRTLTLSKIFSRVPFIVKTRSSLELIENLSIDNAPILFEGIHSTFPLINNSFKNRIKIFRAHNIEHNYYNGLAKSESSKRKKLFYKTESKKLKRFEPIINNVDYILSISPFEFDYFSSKYSPKTIYTPAFHKNNEIANLSAHGEYAFYHGDLRISDNLKSIDYLINIFSKLKHKLIISGGLINKSLLEKISEHKNIEFIKIQSDNHLLELLNDAHVNVLPTFQKTGIKLKLINTLYNSRFCIVNDAMINGTGLENLCEISNSVDSFQKKIDLLFKKQYSDSQRKKREELLQSKFNTTTNAENIVKLIS